MNSQPPRHLFIVNDFPPIIGGQSSYLYYLCRALPPEDVTVLAPVCGDTAAFDAAQPFGIVRKPYLIKVPVLEKLVKIVLPLIWVQGMIRNDRRTVLHCAHVLSTGFIGLFMKKFCGMDYVVYTHSADVLEYKGHILFKPCLEQVLGQAKHVVANSAFTRAQLRQFGVAPERVIVSWPRIDPQECCVPVDAAAFLAAQCLAGRRVLLSLNRLVERKGNDVVIRAMPQLLRQFPDLVYVVFGVGPYRAVLESLIDKLGLKGAVILAEGDDAARRAWLGACELFIMVSREIKAKGDAEGFGVVYLEAGACGKAVVAGDSGGVRDAVENGKTGLLVAPGSPEAVAEAVAKLLSDPAVAGRMGAYGRERVLSRFDFRRGVPELDPVFKEGVTWKEK